MLLSAPIGFVLVFLLEASGGWVDPDSPVTSTVSLRSQQLLELVYSDEFQVDGRSFLDGHDPRWTAVNKNDYTNNALHYYSADMVTTSGGYLNITTAVGDVTFEVDPLSSSKKETKHYQSGMVQGWNKFCFTGGAIEISAKLPGREDVGGLWPALWLMGNLARATYVGSSQNVWPWSYNKCNRDIQAGQEISACNAVNHFDMHPFQGRGSPEIDILEAMMGELSLPKTTVSRPYFSTSLQVSPSMSAFHPDTGDVPDTRWYDHDVEYGENTSLNIFFYGSSLGSGQYVYTTDALSANTNLSSVDYEAFHRYRLEWESGAGGHLSWYLDDLLVYSIEAGALNETGAIIPEEPVYIILNTAVSSTWGFPAPCPNGCSCDCYDCRKEECLCAIDTGFCEMLPSGFLVDYVRVFQNPQNPNHTIGCSPDSHPTAKFIEAHKNRYMDPFDKAPLQEIRAGGGDCRSDSQCSPSGVLSPLSVEDGGTCVRRTCQCPDHLVGPNCLAYAAYDDMSDFNGDDDYWNVLDPRGYGLYLPNSLYSLIILFLVFLTIVVYGKYNNNRRRVSG